MLIVSFEQLSYDSLGRTIDGALLNSYLLTHNY